MKELLTQVGQAVQIIVGILTIVTVILKVDEAKKSTKKNRDKIEENTEITTRQNEELKTFLTQNLLKIQQHQNRYLAELRRDVAELKVKNPTKDDSEI